jgi:hypothetical protein
MKSQKSIRSIFAGEEIVLMDIWLLFWSRRKYLLISILLFIVIGFIQSATSPKEYTAKCVLLGEEGSGGGNSAALTLASLAGISTGSSSGGVTDLYPIVLANRPFLVELSKDTIFQDDKKKTTLMEYFQVPPKVDAVTGFKNAVVNLPSTILGWFRSTPKEQPTKVTSPASIPVTSMADTQVLVRADTPLMVKDPQKDLLDVERVTSQEMQIAGVLKTRIKLETLGRQIIISVRMPEARLSAEATKLVLNKMIEYVVRYKTGKQLDNYKFLEARAAEASRNYKRDQSKVAGFVDNNYGVIFESVKTRQQQLQNDYGITLNTYNQLAAQLEQARIDLKKQTPLFTVLEPVYVPLSPDPSSSMGAITLNAAIGAVVGMVLILLLLFRQYILERKQMPVTA